MEHVTHSIRVSRSRPGFAQVIRKPARSRKKRAKKEKAGRLLERASIVPLLQSLRRWHAPRRVVGARDEIAALGAREHEWLRSHWREYAGTWVALEGNRLVANAAGAHEALEKARAAGVPSPFLIHVTEPSELSFGGW